MYIYYVYAYLRKSDLTPYYIGKGKGTRAFSKQHKVSLPNDKSKIVFLKENVTEREAHNLENELIAKYGRNDLRTGILRNRTNGGEGVSSIVITEKARGAPSAVKKRKSLPPRSIETKEKISKTPMGKPALNKGIPMSKEQKEKLRKPPLVISCPYCNTLSGANSWHLNNRKQRPTIMGGV